LNIKKNSKKLPRRSRKFLTSCSRSRKNRPAPHPCWILYPH